MDVPKYVSGSGLQGKGANCAACLCIMVKLLEGKVWGDHQFCQRQVGETWGYLHWILRLGTGPRDSLWAQLPGEWRPSSMSPSVVATAFLEPLPDKEAHNLINSSPPVEITVSVGLLFNPAPSSLAKSLPLEEGSFPQIRVSNEDFWSWILLLSQWTLLSIFFLPFKILIGV